VSKDDAFADPDGLWRPVFGSELIPYRYYLVVEATFFKKCLSFRRFKSNRDEIWQEYSSSKYASIIDYVGVFNLTSRIRDGGHDVFSCRKVLPSVECTRSVRQLLALLSTVPDSQYFRRLISTRIRVRCAVVNYIPATLLPETFCKPKILNSQSRFL